MKYSEMKVNEQQSTQKKLHGSHIYKKVQKKLDTKVWHQFHI